MKTKLVAQSSIVTILNLLESSAPLSGQQLADAVGLTLKGVKAAIKNFRLKGRADETRKLRIDHYAHIGAARGQQTSFYAVGDEPDAANPIDRDTHGVQREEHERRRLLVQQTDRQIARYASALEALRGNPFATSIVQIEQPQWDTFQVPPASAEIIDENVELDE